MNENLLNEEATHYQKKIRTDELNIRRKCPITCVADVVIRSILPYLMNVSDEESDLSEESDSNTTSDDGSSNNM
jgi:hypothetical protein